MNNSFKDIGQSIMSSNRNSSNHRPLAMRNMRTSTLVDNRGSGEYYKMMNHNNRSPSASINQNRGAFGLMLSQKTTAIGINESIERIPRRQGKVFHIDMGQNVSFR